MGKEITVSSLEEMCDLMCNNRLPEQGIRETCENCKYDRKECGNDDHYGFCKNWEEPEKEHNEITVYQLIQQLVKCNPEAVINFKVDISATDLAELAECVAVFVEEPVDFYGMYVDDEKVDINLSYGGFRYDCD